MKKIKLNLFLNLFQNRSIPPCYSNIKYTHSSRRINLENVNNNANVSNLYSLMLAPSYLDFHVKDGYFLKIIKQDNNGYSSWLDEFTTINSYVKFCFKKNSKVIFKRLRRLEFCFDIEYKFYHGTISFKDYKAIMNALKIMLERRFEQRNDTNEMLLNWENIFNNTYDLIVKQQASFYVVYNKNVPIAISLQYHLDKILLSYMSSYDIDYQKFGLGNTMIYKQIEWCISNSYKYFEQGYCDLEYKRLWSNNVYKFNHHIVYKKGVISAFLNGNIEIIKVIIKEFLKAKNFKVKLKKVKHLINSKEKTSSYCPVKYRSVDFVDSDGKNILDFVDWKKGDFRFLRKGIYDFLYSNLEKIEDVKVFKIKNLPMTFKIQGKNKSVKIIFCN